MGNIQEIRNRMEQAEHNRMKDIYSACKRFGLSEEFAISFYYRMILCPLAQTKSVMENLSRGIPSERFLEDWAVYLQIMIGLYPNHEKRNEWIDSLKLLKIIVDDT